MKTHVQKTNRPAEKSSTSSARKNAAPCAASAFAQETEALEETCARHDIPRGHDFTRTPVFSKTPVRLQTKLTVNAPGDIYEQEADRVAEQVMRMPQPESNGSASAPVKTKPLSASYPGKIEAPAIVDEVLHSPGQPLEASMLAFMEPRFGYDFGGVRVHADAKAADSAQQLRAMAFSCGEKIVFGGGVYEPSTYSGRALIAHELTHLLQQQYDRAPSVSPQHLAVVQRRRKADNPIPTPEILAKLFLERRGEVFTTVDGGKFSEAWNSIGFISQSIEVKDATREIYWTLYFAANAETGDVYVHQVQKGTDIGNYFQGKLPQNPGEKKGSQKKQSIDDEPVPKTDGHAVEDKDRETEPQDPVKSDAKTERTPEESPPPKDGQKNESLRKKRVSKLVEVRGIYLGVLDQSWLPGRNDKGQPGMQGDLGWSCEEALTRFATQIKSSAAFPKTVQINVILYNNTGGPAPGFQIAAPAAAFNIQTFLRGLLPSTITVTSTSSVVDPGNGPGGTQVLLTVTPIY